MTALHAYPFALFLHSFDILSSDSLPQSESLQAIIISLLHVRSCELDDDFKVVNRNVVAVFAELVHDFIYFRFQIFISHQRHQELYCFVTVVLILKDRDYELDAVSDCFK